MLASSAIRLFDFSGDSVKNLLPKTRYTKLYSDIKSATKLLSGLTRKNTRNLHRFRSWSKKFNSWQKYLTRLVINNQNNDCYYLAVALHYILDSYYHIFKKFGVKSKHICKWCGLNINTAWSRVISNIRLDAVPNSYIYTSLIGAGSIKKEDIINKAFFEVKMIYNGILLNSLEGTC